MIKNVIFDVDGVLRLKKNAKVADYLSSETKQKYGNVFEDKTIKEVFKMFFNKSEIHEQYDKGYIDMDEYIGFVSERTKIDKEILDEIMNYVFIFENNIFFEQTFELARQLKKNGYRVFILSNMGKKLSLKLLEWMDTSPFEDILFSCDAHMMKPYLNFYRFAIKKWNIVPEESLFIDDRRDNLAPFAELGGKTFLFDTGNIDESVKTLSNALLSNQTQN